MLDARALRLLHSMLLLALLATLAMGQRPVSQPAVADTSQAVALNASLQAVVWPPSAGLLVSEVVTGGASASDEFVELYNAAASPLALANLELVYVTASGGTVTRKQSWTDLQLQPGQHLLLANSAGTYASLADGLYSGGFAATGGTLVLRVIGGSVIDSLSWGDASSSFVEGAPGPAPSAGSSLERKPGGSAGNGSDTNDNLADTRIEAAPRPQPISAPAVPPPSPVTSPAPTSTPPMPSLEPDPSLEPEPTLEPEPSSEPEPSIELTPSAVPDSSFEPMPTPAADPSPSLQPSDPAPSPPASPSPLPSQPPTSEPSNPPSPLAPTSIAQARSLPLGSNVTVQGWLTTQTGLTETGKGAFLEDAGAGIALYLAAADWPSLPTGTEVRATGTLETRFSLLTLRLASAANLEIVGGSLHLEPLPVLTGEVGEAIEGRLVVVEAVVSDGISTLTDGFSTAVDDGSGAVRVVAAAASGIERELLPRGALVRVVGVVGQRDSSGTGTAGYRLHPRSSLDVERLAEASPSPSPVPTMTPSPSPTPAPTVPPSASPQPSPVPSASPTPTGLISIAAARQAPVGARVAITGVVTVRPGYILGDQVIALQDATAGICVKLPAGSHPEVVPGRVLEVSGVLAAPYGNLELRVSEGSLAIVDTASQPAPRLLSVAELGEATEGLLARLNVTIRRIDSGSAGTVTLIVEDASGEGRIFLHDTLGMTRADFSTGQQIVATGIVGDRLGLYRLWPRSASDISFAPGGPSPSHTPGSTPTPAPSPSPSGGSPVISIAQALSRTGESVTIEGTVSAPPGLLDADPRRVTVEDGSAGILVRLPADGPQVALGTRLRVTGQVGTYYGAPQLTAVGPVSVLERNVALSAVKVSSAPIAAGLEWRLVTVSGKVESVRRDGQAWRAELTLSGGGVPIVGLARSGLASTLLAAGRDATITGIVRRAYPTATDQRLAVVPRSAGDIRLGSVGAGTPPSPGGPAEPGAAGLGSSMGQQLEGDAQAGLVQQGTPHSVLSQLVAYEGMIVRVGGRIERLDGLRIVLDDGTGSAIVRLSGRAAPVALQLVAGMFVNAQGAVERTAAGALEVHVADPAAIRYAFSPQAAQRSEVAGALGELAQGELSSESVARQNRGLSIRWLGLLLLAGSAGCMTFLALDRQRLERLRALAMAVLVRRGR